MSAQGSYSKLFLLLVHVLEPVLPPTDNNMTLSQTDASSRAQGSAFSPRLFSFLFFLSLLALTLDSVSEQCTKSRKCKTLRQQQDP